MVGDKWQTWGSAGWVGLGRVALSRWVVCVVISGGVVWIAIWGGVGCGMGLIELRCGLGWRRVRWGGQPPNASC